MDTGEIPLAIFIDLSKAFDTLDHITLMHKLSYYGVQGTALTLFQSYLSNRKQYVQFDNVDSDLANNRCPSRLDTRALVIPHLHERSK